MTLRGKSVTMLFQRLVLQENPKGLLKLFTLIYYGFHGKRKKERKKYDVVQFLIPGIFTDHYDGQG